MRARINERLLSATRFPVTLIVAPAGFGKSVALRDFLDSSKIDAVRYDVRREDNTLLSFVRRFSEALECVAPSALASFPSMQERVLAAEEPVRQLSDWFVEHLKHVHGAIVIDDLHYAAVDPASIALIADVVERTSGQITWIIAARSDVGLPVATWIAYGRMDMPIGEDDLRFTTDEALATAAEAGTGVEAHEAEALRQLTEGWPVALTIALRTRTHSTDLRTASLGTREMVYRYLAEQVFSGLTLQQRAFALSSSVFSSFDAGLAHTLGATPEFLSELRSKLTFLSESPQREYRYHELFRDFLETELRRSGEQEWSNAVCHAARLLEQREQYADALLLYTKARSVENILRIIERYGFSLFERGQGEPLSAALAVVPERDRKNNAAALGLRAMLDASRGHFELAEPEFLGAIEEAVDPTLRLTLVHRYAIELVRHGMDCVDFVRPHATDESLPPSLRVPLLGTLATGYVRRRDLESATATIETALELLQHIVDDDARARVLQQAAHVFDVVGNSERAQRYAKMAIDLAMERNLFDLAARAYSILYGVRYDEDDIVGSLEMLDRLCECARKGASSQTLVYGLIASYGAQAELGNESALQALDTALQENQASLPATRAESLLPALALRAAWNGDFKTAFGLLANTASSQNGAERRSLRAAETALYAAAAGLQEETDAATAEAEEHLKNSPPSGGRSIRARILLALTDMVRGKTAQAHRLLSSAEQNLAPGMRRLRALCAAARAAYRVQLQQAEKAEFDRSLHALSDVQFGGFARLFESLPLGVTNESGFGVLTPAEREILTLLAKGASTKDVANRTGRSPHTVDTHIRSMCRKLGCSGRREAVALATSQGWVQS